jgi:hypothetical protein
MTILKVWKRIHCPKCEALIRVRYATDGSFILQDSKPSLLPPSEQSVPEDFTEAQEIIINTMIERKIAEAIDKLLDDYDIHEKPLLNEEREED